MVNLTDIPRFAFGLCPRLFLCPRWLVDLGDIPLFAIPSARFEIFSYARDGYLGIERWPLFPVLGPRRFHLFEGADLIWRYTVFSPLWHVELRLSLIHI